MANLGNMALQRPLVANVGNLDMERPLVANLGKSVSKHLALMYSVYCVANRVRLLVRGLVKFQCAVA